MSSSPRRPRFSIIDFARADSAANLLSFGKRPLTDGLHVRRIDAFLESQSRMERHGPCAAVGHRVGEQNDLNLRFGKAAAMYIPEQADEAVDQNRRSRDRAGNVRDHSESRLQLLQRRLRAFRGGVNSVNGKVCHVSRSLLVFDLRSI